MAKEVPLLMMDLDQPSLRQSSRAQERVAVAKSCGRWEEM